MKHTILVSRQAGLTSQEIKSILADFSTTSTEHSTNPTAHNTTSTEHNTIPTEHSTTPAKHGKNPAAHGKTPVKTLYASEYDIPTFRQHCSPEICGLLIGYPFGGLSDNMVLTLINLAAELDCQRAVITLSVNDLASSCLNSFKKKILTYAQKAGDCSLECVWEIPAALLTEPQLAAALKIIAETSHSQTSHPQTDGMQTGRTRLSLASGTSLDPLDIQTLRTADRLISQLAAPILLEVDQRLYAALKTERNETPENNANSKQQQKPTRKIDTERHREPISEPDSERDREPTGELSSLVELRTFIPQDGGITP